MHKITKGLKKKKKGKKSKHKEEELFKPEELEAYRREHQQTSTPSAPLEEVDQKDAPATANDEWKKFNALTSGIDNILKKTQDDLDRIKSTSFFQRVPTPSEVKRREEAEASEEQALPDQSTVRVEEPIVLEPGIVQVSESESEEEEEDIFDTSYIDVIAAGEVKLAYIPESPTEQPEGDDPFDTSIAERAILGPAVERKGKKVVPLGFAVEVLTGRVQAPTCVPIKRPSTRRTILKERDLLLGSFDDNANSVTDKRNEPLPESKPSLLDDDAPFCEEPIDLSKSLYLVNPTSTVVRGRASGEKPNKSVVEEFDIITKAVSQLEDEDDKEFALLAAESLSKTPGVAILPTTVAAEIAKEDWKAFDEEKHKGIKGLNGITEDRDEDPFDTTFAENVAPGKCELKIIENEILSTENDIDFNPRAEDKLTELIKNQVSIQVTNPAGQESSLERISESELNSIQPQHRDLLGGSITDLSSLGDQPLKPKEQIDENYIEYCDPFDTTIVETATAPGQAELKFLEKELLSDIQTKNACEISDDEFDPRAEEYQEQLKQHRKSSGAGVNKTVAFTLPIPASGGDLFAVEEEDSTKASKPLTPYYVRENSLPEQVLSDQELEDADPFDTSFVTAIGPGKAELKVIETELFQPESSLKHSISDQDFNPRDEKQVAVAKVVQTIKEISDPANLNKPKDLPVRKPKQIDLLAVDNEVTTKVLTPAAEKATEFGEISYADPFDTSIANNILPGKAELKLLETELIHSNSALKRVLTDPDFNPRDSVDPKDLPPKICKEEKPNVPDLLEHTTVDTVTTKPLTPVVGSKVSFDLDYDEDVDPFDTSIANNLGPGQTELKLLESELI